MRKTVHVQLLWRAEVVSDDMSTERGGGPSDLLFRLAGRQEFGDRPPDDEGVGPARAVDIEGRGVGCWGPLLAQVDAGGRWIRLECRLCGRHLCEEDAAGEVERMAREAEDNMAKVRVGRGAVYREDARFVFKILPDMDRDRDWFERRVTAALEAMPKKNHLGRRDLLAPRDAPSGHHDDDAEYAVASFLYGQASALVSGLSALPDEISAIDLRDFDFEKREIARV